MAQASACAYDLEATGNKKTRCHGHFDQSTLYQEFERKMKSLGYSVLKGRGISFIDDKKVKIKGSEVSVSLSTIERILELRQKMPVYCSFYWAQAICFFSCNAGPDRLFPVSKSSPYCFHRPHVIISEPDIATYDLHNKNRHSKQQ